MQNVNVIQSVESKNTNNPKSTIWNRQLDMIKLCVLIKATQRIKAITLII